MNRLQRVLATGVLDALRTREHVLVSPASSDALCDEVEAIIAPAIDDITRLEKRPRARKKRASQAEAAVESMVDRITDRLMQSDHVDDIFASDRVIRRDAYRAIREILLGYIHGEIEVAEDLRDDFPVLLDSLGYLVSCVSRKLPLDVLGDALERAAASVGGRFVTVDTAVMIATFDLPGGAEVGRLAIEEAVSGELLALVDADMVDLPNVEQVLELDEGSSAAPGFADAIARAEARTRCETGCAATCQLVDPRTLIATLMPLSSEAAERAEDLFLRFLATLEEELSAVPSDELGPTSKKPESGRRRGARPKDDDAAPRSAPKSQRRGSAAPAGRASRTRSTQKRTTSKGAGPRGRGRKKRGAK